MSEPKSGTGSDAASPKQRTTEPASKPPAPPESPAKSSTASRDASSSAQSSPPKPAAKKSPSKTKPSASRPLTAADYAKTTTGSPSATSVIPAVANKEPSPQPAATKPPTSDGIRQARLRLIQVEPWSVTKLAFAVSVAIMIVSVVAITIFWIVLEVTGVWTQIDDVVNTVLSNDTSSFNIAEYLGLGRLVGLALVLSAANVVLMTALAAIGARIYNAAAQLLGGLEVTFADH